MQANHGPTPIPIPPIVDHPSHIGRLSREIRRSIKALKDRQVIITGRGGGGSGTGSTCAGFRIYKKIVSGTAHVFVEAGQIGSEMIVETDLGTLESMEAKHVIVEVTLNGEDGTYTSQVISKETLDPPTDVLKYTVLGYVGELTGTSTPEGRIVQIHCGAVDVTVCRNWYAAEAPFYGMSLSTE